MDKHYTKLKKILGHEPSPFEMTGYKLLIQGTPEAKNDLDEKVENYSPSQARDGDGKWTDGGGGSSQAPLTSLNPTGGLMVDYKPSDRATAPLGPNMTTLAATTGRDPDTKITIYRGAPSNQKKIVPGDFITDMKELAEAYTGDGNILSKEVRLGDILDDADEPEGNEYIYRPGADEEIAKKKTENKFNPSQPRDKDGQWSDGGGGGSVVSFTDTNEADSYIQKQKQSFNKSEEDAISFYQVGSGFSDINKMHRSGDQTYIDTLEFYEKKSLGPMYQKKSLSELKDVSSKIDSLISSNTVSESVKAYRIVSSNSISDVMSPKLYNDKGFMSASISKNFIDKNKARWWGRDNTFVLEIDVPKGTNGVYPSNITGGARAEAELLLGRDTALEYISHTVDGKITYVKAGIK